MYDVCKAMVAWLKGHGYHASTVVWPDSPQSPSEFVTVERTGGRASDMVDHPTLAIQAWAQSDKRAYQLASEVRLLALTDRPDGVHSLAVNSGPYRFYDEDTRCPRYQLVLDVSCQLLE